MDHEHIYDWTAQRAGASLTVYGKTLAGEPRRLVGVKWIGPDVHGRVIALGKGEVRYVLATTLRAALPA